MELTVGEYCELFNAKLGPAHSRIAPDDSSITIGTSRHPPVTSPGRWRIRFAPRRRRGSVGTEPAPHVDSKGYADGPSHAEHLPLANSIETAYSARPKVCTRERV
jgi:hypothetical protein